MFGAQHPDLVITDLAMPNADGFHVVRAVRKAGTTPILVLSVRGEEEDKVRALDLGADDFITKPFSVAELLARVRAQLRRSGAASGGALRFPGLALDRDRRRVTVDGREVRLTPTEFAILELLAANAGRPVPLAQIIARVWRGAPATTNDTVRVHVGSLRRKIEPDRGAALHRHRAVGWLSVPRRTRFRLARGPSPIESPTRKGVCRPCAEAYPRSRPGRRPLRQGKPGTWAGTSCSAAPSPSSLDIP